MQYLTYATFSSCCIIVMHSAHGISKATSQYFSEVSVFVTTLGPWRASVDCSMRMATESRQLRQQTRFAFWHKLAFIVLRISKWQVSEDNLILIKLTFDVKWSWNCPCTRCEETELQINAFLASALDGVEWLAWRSGRFSCRKYLL